MKIYAVTNNVTGKKYIGLTTKTGSKFDKYWGSGKIIKSSIKKHGIENFTKEILQECSTKKEMCEAEKYWILKLDTIFPNGYNISDGGFDGDAFAGMSIKQLSDIFNKRKTDNPDMYTKIKQMRLNNGGYKKTKEQYLKCVDINRKITSNPEWRQQIKQRLSNKHPVTKKYSIKNINTDEVIDIDGVIGVKAFLKEYNDRMGYTNNRRANVCALCEDGNTRDFILLKKESAYYASK